MNAERFFCFAIVEGWISKYLQESRLDSQITEKVSFFLILISVLIISTNNFSLD